MPEQPAAGDLNPPFLPEQEVRFAVVMYGGVSLAIYINGVAQELFRLVKATAPADPYPVTQSQPAGERRAYFSDPGSGDPRPPLEHSECVYRELGQWLRLDGPAAPDGPEGEPAPIRTRFVVDILSGTSAGGINGVFLGKAIANQQEFGVSADLWLKVADIGELLRGEASWDGIPEAGRREPESLLNGHRLFWEARKALTAMEAGRTEVPEDLFRPAYAEQLELAVTATDLAGQTQPVRLGRDRVVSEPVHRKVFQFEYGLAETLGEEHSDFKTSDDLMLAFAARATSSFPFAFEPVKLDDVAFMSPDHASVDPAPWFEGYADPGSVFFADGGYLDNKPFSYATQALRRRRADVPVSRKLIYIEPDPAPDTPVHQAGRERPDVYQNVADAMAGLPRFEPIRQDIADVTDRNAAVARLRAIEMAAMRAVERNLGAAAAPTDGPSREAYLSLRARTVLDRLADHAARLRGWRPDEPSAIDARDALGAWAAGQEDREQQLERLDTAFLQRRLSFLQDRANELLRGGARLAAMRAVAAKLPGAAAPGPDDDDESLPAAEAEQLRGFKLALNEAFNDLRRAQRAASARSLADTLDEHQLDRFTAVGDASLVLVADPAGYVDAVSAFLERPLLRAREGIATALSDLAAAAWTGGLLEAYDARFETFDQVVLPLAYPDLGEVNAVELWRVSPRDAASTAPAQLEDPVAKLAGLQLHHFGAFLDESYRENDLLWGRLDAAEAIVRAVLPEPGQQALRDRFRIAAQAAILREGLPERLGAPLAADLARPAGEENDALLVQAFLATYTPPPELSDDRRDALTGQGLAIAGQVLAKDAAKHHVPELPLQLLGHSGPAIVKVVGVRARVRERLKKLNPFD